MVETSLLLPHFPEIWLKWNHPNESWLIKILEICYKNITKSRRRPIQEKLQLIAIPKMKFYNCWPLSNAYTSTKVNPMGKPIRWEPISISQAMRSGCQQVQTKEKDPTEGCNLKITQRAGLRIKRKVNLKEYSRREKPSKWTKNSWKIHSTSQVGSKGHSLR